MLSLKNFLRRLKTPYTYNIGFVDIRPENVVEAGGLGRRNIQWLRHSYNDRWFADPFIFDVTPHTIEVFAEEKQYGRPGSLVRLSVSRKDKKLISRQSILGLSTHLSYPNIIEIQGKKYVYPENSQSGELNIYEITGSGMLKRHSTLIPRALNDSSIIFDEKSGYYFLIATDADIDCHSMVQMFKSKSVFGPWEKVGEDAIVKDSGHGRPGGNFFKVGKAIYRPAQDCAGLYGNSLHIMEILSFEPYVEKEIAHIRPKGFRYSYGIHTLNFHDSGIAVVDGNGYAWPVAGHLLGPLIEKIIH